MVKTQFFLLVLVLVLSACSTEEELTATALESQEPSLSPTEVPTRAPTPTPVPSPTPEIVEFDLTTRIQIPDVGYTIPYPENWFADIDGRFLTISDSLTQLGDQPGTQFPLEGYAIDIFHMPKEWFVRIGMPDDPTLQELLETATDFNNAENTRDSVETTLFGFPAIRARADWSYDMEPAHAVEAIVSLQGDRIFLLVMHAINEEELDKFLPTWREMVEGIEPSGATAEESSGSPNELVAEEWEMITSDGSSVCADGSSSAYWVHPGSEEKLLIYFQGPYHNTFCLDAETCEINVAIPWIDPAIHLSDEFDHQSLIDMFADEPQRLTGALDLSNSDIPFIDFTMVYLPYCTGDLFMGDVTRSYSREDGTAFEIYHHGFSNAQAALDIVYKNFTNPEQILVAGCEAGAVGALMQIPSLAENYPDSRIVQLSEAFSGVFGEPIDFNQAWDVRENLPESMESVPDSFTITELTIELAKRYPQVSFSQFNYAEDGVQATAYTTAGRPGYSGMEIAYDDFTSALMAGLDTIHNQAPNFYSYTLEGTNETTLCALDSNLLLWLKSGDTYYVDWLLQLLNGEEVANIIGEPSYEAR